MNTHLLHQHDDLWNRLTHKTFFLTGGTGFFGKSFLQVIKYINECLNLNIKIILLTRNSSKFKNDFPDLQGDYISYIDGDILDFPYHNVKIDYIFHFATPASATLNIENPLAMLDIIVDGTRRVLNFAVHSQCKSVLLASSGAVYGTQPTEVTHIPESYLGAPSTSANNAAYGEGKRLAELLGNIYSSKYGFEHKIARCFAFTGPYLDPHGTFAIGNFIKNAIEGNAIFINGDGSPMRSYLYADDLVVWLIKILLDGKNKIAYNVGSDHDLNIKQLAEKVIALVNPKAQLHISQKIISPNNPSRYVPNIDLAKKDLQLNVWTSLDDSILRTAKEYRNFLQTN